jgi:hypothetical protein
MGIGLLGVDGSVVVLHVVEEVNIEIGLVLILHLNLEELIVPEMKPVLFSHYFYREKAILSTNTY